jgi:sugar lactone lactonase YvrE
MFASFHRLGRLISLPVTVLALLFGPGSTSQAQDQMQYPLSVATVDDVVFVADLRLPGIWKLTAQGPEKFYEGSAKFRTPLNAVRCLAVDQDGRLLAGDSATREVYRFDADGKPTPLTKGGIGIPMGIAVRQSGELLVSDLELHCIWKVPAEGGKPERLATVPSPTGIFLDSEDQLWVVSRGTVPLRRVAPDGTVTDVVKDRKFSFPHDVVVDEAKTVFVTDGYAKAIWKIESGQEPVKFVEGEPLTNPVGLIIDGDRFLVADSHAKNIFQVSRDGKVTPLQ